MTLKAFRTRSIKGIERGFLLFLMILIPLTLGLFTKQAEASSHGAPAHEVANAHGNHSGHDVHHDAGHGGHDEHAAPAHGDEHGHDGHAAAHHDAGHGGHDAAHHDAGHGGHDEHAAPPAHGDEHGHGHDAGHHDAGHGGHDAGHGGHDEHAAHDAGHGGHGHHHAPPVLYYIHWAVLLLGVLMSGLFILRVVKVGKPHHESMLLAFVFVCMAYFLFISGNYVPSMARHFDMPTLTFVDGYHEAPVIGFVKFVYRVIFGAFLTVYAIFGMEHH